MKDFRRECSSFLAARVWGVAKVQPGDMQVVIFKGLAFKPRP